MNTPRRGPLGTVCRRHSGVRKATTECESLTSVAPKFSMAGILLPEQNTSGVHSNTSTQRHSGPLKNWRSMPRRRVASCEAAGVVDAEAF